MEQGILNGKMPNHKGDIFHNFIKGIYLDGLNSSENVTTLSHFMSHIILKNSFV